MESRQQRRGPAPGPLAEVTSARRGRERAHTGPERQDVRPHRTLHTRSLHHNSRTRKTSKAFSRGLLQPCLRHAVSLPQWERCAPTPSCCRVSGPWDRGQAAAARHNATPPGDPHAATATEPPSWRSPGVSENQS
uniref:Uncharacterized protein n=1 Tax=Molossus molossus TaxID=27622 RepID=A0A7J8GS47_MOLMO|nr:hypothetical protein HJG59_011393 [Molossus molossus]